MGRQRSRAGKKIDYVHWHGVNAFFGSLSAGTAAQNVVGNLSTHPETLLRIRGNLLCSLNGVNAPGALTEVAVGILVVPGGTGTTVTSSPLTDSDAP